MQTLNQISRQAQMAGMMSSLDVPKPQILQDFLDALDVLSLDITIILGRAAIPSLSYRTFFFIVACGLPMFLNVLLLLLANPWHIVLWYVTLVVGAVLMLVGVLGRLLPGASATNAEVARNLAIVGGSLTGAALLLLLAKLIKRRFCVDESDADNDGDGEDNEEEMDEAETEMFSSLSRKEQFEYRMKRSLAEAGGDPAHYENKQIKKERLKLEWAKKFHRRRTLTHMCVTFLLVFAGLIVSGILKLSLPGLSQSSDEVLSSQTYRVIGLITLSLGAVAFIYMVLHTFETGRSAALWIVTFLRDNMLRVLIIAVLFSFIPVVSMSVDTMMCTEYTCPEGTIFNPHASRPPGSHSKDPKYFCDACKFEHRSLASMCNGTAGGPKCPAFTGKRLFADPNARCDDEGYAYMIISATIVLVTMLGGVPLLFFFMVRELSDLIPDSAEIVECTELNAPDLTEQEREEKNWQKYQAAVPAVAGSMYSPFTFEMRYYNLYDLLQRFIFVIILNVVAPFTSVAAVLVLAGHVIFMGLLLAYRPYYEFSLQFFAVLLAFANVLNSSLMVALWASDNAEKLEAFAIVAISTNAIISVVGGSILVVLEFRAMGQKKKEFETEAQEQEDELVGELERTQTAPDFDSDTKAAIVAEAKLQTERNAVHNEIVTVTVNQQTLESMSKQFMAMGIAVSIAFFFAVLGVLRDPEQTAYVGSSALHQSTTDTLAGYESWANFTQDCCCAPGTVKFDDYNVTERWVCRNGKSVTRGRQNKDGAHNGLLLRSLCNTTFEGDCVLTVNEVTGKAAVTCGDAFTQHLKKLPDPVHDFAFQLYW